MSILNRGFEPCGLEARNRRDVQRSIVDYDYCVRRAVQRHENDASLAVYPYNARAIEAPSEIDWSEC